MFDWRKSCFDSNYNSYENQNCSDEFGGGIYLEGLVR